MMNKEQGTIDHKLYAERLYHKGTMSEGVLKDTPADIPFRDPLGQTTNY